MFGCSLRKYAILMAIAVTSVIVTGISCHSSGLQILSHQLTAREFTGDLNQTRAMAAVTGTARNMSGGRLTSCTITVTFYDANRNNIGTATGSKESLDQGETWNFSVQLTDPDAWKARSYAIEASSQ